MSGGWSALSRADMTRIGAAVIFFISTFLPAVGVSISGLGGRFSVSVSIDAWHSYALLGVLIVLAAIAVWAVRSFTSVVLPTIPRGWDFAIPVAGTIGLLLILLRVITWTGNGVGLRYGAFLLIISGAVFVASTWNAGTLRVPTETA